MPTPWPDPLDTPADRIKAVARALFEVVLELAPERALRIRALAEELGLWFLSPPPLLEPGQRVTDAEAARGCEVTESTIRNWVAAGLVTRYPDGLDGGELLNAQARQRRKRGRR